MPPMDDLSTALQQAVTDFAEHGYDSEARLEEWTSRIRHAAEKSLIPEREVLEKVKATLGAVYDRLIERGSILRRHPGVERFTLQRVKPALREELNRRILASAALIRLNRDRAIEETLQRFAGWATSVPPGGSDVVRRTEVKTGVKRELTQIAYQARRVAIDQGHKFTANLSQILAKDSGAIAATWHQHWTRNPRHTHTERDGKVFLIRDSWAQERGFVKPGPAGYLDDITQPGVEINCRCTATYWNALRRLPDDMLTERGRQARDEARVA